MATDPRSPVCLAPHFIFHSINSSQGQIRLLEVAPGRNDEPIRCLYKIANVTDNVSYQTISYVWGSMDSKRTIFVEGTAVELTENLFHALHRMRHATGSRWLWVDALCINQDDDAEKTAQVNMMHQIYSSCSQCAIWMGNIDTADLAATETEALAAARGALDAIRILAGEDTGPDLPTQLVTQHQHVQAGKALKALMSAQWWSRIWTVQEATSPRNLTVFWGPLSIPWSLVKKAAENLIGGRYLAEGRLDWYDLFPDGGAGFYTAPILGLIWAAEWAVQSPPPLEMLWRFRYRDSTDPRDKVYVILNLVPEGSYPLPSVPSSDYSISTATLFRNVMLDLLRDEQGLRPMIGFRGEHKRTPGLPSWVVDWSLPREGEGIARLWEHNQFWFDYTADRGLPMLDLDQMTSPQYGEEVLNLNGLFYDKVLARSDVIAEKWDEDRLKEMITTLIAQTLAEEPRHRVISEVYWQKALSDLIEGAFVDQTAELEGMPADEYWRDCMLGNQRLFITENGAVGLGPSTTSLGDEIWVLSGGRLPFLLGSLDIKEVAADGGESSNHYQFRGDIFMPGIMSGEAVDSRKEAQQIVHIH
ncbi:HET-domain-containing protein [Xylariaceae sp. FL1651]|nr:HET-domain-containing protein [Xylariaceae sp. FL1651]